MGNVHPDESQSEPEPVVGKTGINKNVHCKKILFRIKI